jgi:transforming growth factor-beta-induced protein
MKLNFVVSALLFGYAIGQNIVEVAVGSPDLSALVDAVVLAELDGALSTTQLITVFAPTDDAFGKLHQASLNLLKTEQWRPHLENLLLQHVLPAEVPSSDITDGIMTAALNGEEVKLNLPLSGGVIVNGIANVIQADVSADNGVIHVVDTVLFPEWVSNNIFDRAVADPELTTLTTLITGLKLTRALSFHGPYTVFAPTDEAFLEGLVSLGAEDGYLSAHLASTLLTYHVVHGIYSAADIVDGLELTTAQGEKIVFSFKGDIPQVNGEDIVATDILANNGIVHKIDSLLIPKSVIAPVEQTIVDVALSNSDTFSTLVDFVVQADLVAPLSSTQGITVFAPTNDAFAALASAAPDVVANLQTKEWSTHLQDVLLYHVLPVEVPSSAVTDGLATTALNGEDLSFDVNGDGIFVNSNSAVVIADVGASNGVIHAIDSVLIPSWVSNSIVDRAVGSPALTTLVDLVVGAGLAGTLSGAGPFTVFAPTNDAFLEFLGNDFDAAGSLDIDFVASILKYHVVPGIYSAADIANGLSLTTVQGEDIVFSLMGSTAMVNGETIVAADILANNGIVHVIDGVLIPIEATASLVMQASLSEDTTLAMIGSEQSSSSGYRTSFAAATATLMGFGVAIGVVF